MTEPLLAATVRLTSALEALAALTAATRVRSEGLHVPPEISRLLDGVVAELTDSADGRVDPTGPQAIGMATAFLRESIAFVDDPGRVGGWSTTDPAVLQGVGKLSMSIAPVIAAAAQQLDGLHASLTSDSAEMLDVGTGCGWLALALARAFPLARVTGIDIFEPALALAGANVATEPGGDRVEIVECDVTHLDTPSRFDAVWLPLPFLPAAIVPEAIRRCAAALKRGGWLLPGTFGGPTGRLAELLTDLRIVRSGGHPWTPTEMTAMLTNVGLGGAQEIERTWPAPVRLFAAQRID
jgi:protein-L-isoaspartate O-methyltransferase